jgi:hypothetical protein
LALDGWTEPGHGIPGVQVAELGLESDTEALAFAEQVQLLQQPEVALAPYLLLSLEPQVLGCFR